MARPADVLAATAKANLALDSTRKVQHAAEKLVEIHNRLEDKGLREQTSKIVQAAQRAVKLMGTHRRPCESRSHSRRPGRAPRRATNAHQRGSRRLTRAGPSDDDGESEPPGPKLWRHPELVLLQEGGS